MEPFSSSSSSFPAHRFQTIFHDLLHIKEKDVQKSNENPDQEKLHPVCKSQLSRTACYDLLGELVRGCTANYTALHQLLIAQHQVSDDRKDDHGDHHSQGGAIDDGNVQAASHKSYPWEYWPREEGRSECGHVGLLNLGATCYMATAVQQLFMIPATRACILQGDGLGPTDPSFGKHLSTLYELRR